jgi:pyruvate/2-oxoglutarate dehydrogenase complex dihydrolipoamide acyltransferase (E2) component
MKPRPLLPVALSLIAGLVLAGGGAAVFGQEKAETAARPAANAQPAAAQPPAVQPPPAQPAAAQPAGPQAGVRKDQLSQPRVAAQPGTAFVGPPEPRSAAMQPQIVGQAEAGKPASDVPAPTVVLKPGEVPAIAFDTQTWDWGRIRSGPDVSHDYWFTNTGTGPLEILKVRPG